MQTQTPARPDDSSADPVADILIVDDETRNLLALEAVLEAPGRRMVRATSGEEALLALMAHEFACILLDVQMPGMTGFELARMIQQRARTARVPIIFLTAHLKDDHHVLEGYAHGAVDYLLKPFNPRVLRQKVDVLVDLHRINRRLRAQAAQHEQQASLHSAALQEADRRKDDFLAMLAHELRTPLAPIRSAAYIMGDTAAPQASVDRARAVIARQVGHLARLVDGLLDVSRLVHGKMRLSKEPLDLAVIVEGALESNACQLHERRQAIDVALATARIDIHGDGVRLVQALANVIDNASRFSGSDTVIRIAASCANGEARISVRDQGCGIPPEFLPCVFDLFAQGDQSPDRPHGGVGIGLTLVKATVELHDGRVAVHSNGRGEGAEVVIHLPAQVRGSSQPL